MVLVTFVTKKMHAHHTWPWKPILTYEPMVISNTVVSGLNVSLHETGTASRDTHRSEHMTQLILTTAND